MIAGDVEDGRDLNESFGNVAELIEGRMPQDVSECAIEEFASQNLGLRIGDSITLYDAEGKKKAEHLKVNEFVIVGTTRTPLLEPSSEL